MRRKSYISGDSECWRGGPESMFFVLHLGFATQSAGSRIQGESPDTRVYILTGADNRT